MGRGDMLSLIDLAAEAPSAASEPASVTLHFRGPSERKSANHATRGSQQQPSSDMAVVGTSDPGACSCLIASHLLRSIAQP